MMSGSGSLFPTPPRKGSGTGFTSPLFFLRFGASIMTTPFRTGSDEIPWPVKIRGIFYESERLSYKNSGPVRIAGKKLSFLNTKEHNFLE
jgi:hypothetical protein